MFIKVHFSGSGKELYLNTDKVLLFSEEGAQTLVTMQGLNVPVGVRETARDIAKIIAGTENE